MESPFAEQVGEDAFFLRSDSLGIADGVGGMRNHAFADPGRWAKKIMHLCSSELGRYEDVEDELFAGWAEVKPQDVLQRAFDRAKRDAVEEGIVGSTTALLAVLRNDELRLTNIGDCCCFIIRGRDYIFRLEEQQHSFNYPFQLSTFSEKTSVPSKDAQNFTVKVQRDDIIVLSSDGLVDNLFDDDILDEVLRFSSPTSASSSTSAAGQLKLRPFSPRALSEALCSRAKAVSEDQLAVTSPFQQKAMEEGMYYVGGKKDDITTVICLVQGAEEVGRHEE
ncbi:protein serine/threonine phosphatase 2C [Atractiella rhizophila]|nr:protein serine/threonine phosphatase 2C [Atractiella rhizophila]